MPDYKNCPKCNTEWERKETICEFFQSKYEAEGIPDYILRDNPDISFEDAAKKTGAAYGCTEESPRHFGVNVTGVAISCVYDGILYLRCENCNAHVHRFSGKITDGMPKEHQYELF